MNQKEQTKNQQHKSLSSILEYPFDFQRYIEEQLREIDDLDERRFMKRIMVEGLGSMIRQTERKYQELENRIYRETAVPASAYGIVFTIIKKEHYDPANDTLYPVCPMDFNPKVCGEELSTEEYQYIGTVFLQADRQTCREFEARGTYAGVMLVEGEEAPATIHIRKAERYRHGVTDLYRMFLDNHIRWATVNTGYLDKYYDIFVSRKGMPEGAFPGDIKICFGEYGEMVQKDMMPLWNIERLSFSGRSFMMPCTDGISYEHELLLENTGYEDGYLVRMNDDILGIRHEEGKIIIKSLKETYGSWKAVRIIQKKAVRSLDYNAPFLSNRKKDSFVRGYAGQFPGMLLTEAELYRKIEELDIADYIEIKGYRIEESGKGFPEEEGMDWFAGNSLFPMEGRRILLLNFAEKEKGNYLNDSMVCFAVSHLQAQIGEYRCIGVLI